MGLQPVNLGGGRSFEFGSRQVFHETLRRAKRISGLSADIYRLGRLINGGLIGYPLLAEHIFGMITNLRAGELERDLSKFMRAMRILVQREEISGVRMGGKSVVLQRREEWISGWLTGIEHGWDSWIGVERAENILQEVTSEPKIIDSLRTTLEEALRDADDSVRISAAEALGELGDSGARPALESALRDANLRNANLSVRISAAEALGRLGDSGALESALRDENWYVRRSAAKALGQLGFIEITQPALEEALRDGDWFVRISAAEALGKLGDSGALESALRDENWYVRISAAKALGRLGCKDVLERLLNTGNPSDKILGAYGLVQWISIERVIRVLEGINDYFTRKFQQSWAEDTGGGLFE